MKVKTGCEAILPGAWRGYCEQNIPGVYAMQIPTVKYENHKNSSHVIKDDREIAKGIQTVVAIFKLYT